MVIIESHFNCNKTYIVGNYVANGCQIFHIDELDKVCQEYDVPTHMKLQVRDNWKENKISHPKEHPDDFISSEIAFVRCIVARYGDRQLLDILVNDIDPYVRIEVLGRGRNIHMDVLVNDKTTIVRKYSAMVGRPQDLDILVHDKEWSIRKEVARHGRPCDLDILVKDISWTVRVTVAGHARDQDLDILVNDQSPYVLITVAKQKRDKDLVVLTKHKHEEVFKQAAVEIMYNKARPHTEDIHNILSGMEYIPC